MEGSRNVSKTVKIGEVSYEVRQDMIPRVAGFGRTIAAVVGVLILGSISSVRFRNLLFKFTAVGGIGFAVLLLCMRASKSFTNKIVSRVIPIAMSSHDKTFRKVKMELLKDIKGDVLDFGSGDGQYLQYIARSKGKVKSVVCLEPMRELHKPISSRARKLDLNSVEIYGGYSSSLLAEKGKECFDFIIIGNVLCEVPDQTATLDDLYQMLRPNGIAFFLEHVVSESDTFLSTIQNLINPVWRTLSGGCNCNRRTLLAIKKQPWQLHVWEFTSNGPVPFLKDHIAGLAHKVT